MRNKARLEQEGGWQESADPVGRIIRQGWALILEVGDDAWEGGEKITSWKMLMGIWVG